MTTTVEGPGYCPGPSTFCGVDSYYKPVSSTVLILISGRLLLLMLQSGHEHFFCPLVRFHVVLENPVEEFHQLLIALLLGVLDVALERFGILRRLVRNGVKFEVLSF